MALRLKRMKDLPLDGVLKRPKFRVAPKDRRTLDGIVFDSAAEMRRYSELKLSQRAGLIRSLELQPSFEVEIGGKHFCKYTADFRYETMPEGEIIIEEVKSQGTIREKDYRLRKKAAELFHGITVKVVVRK